MKLKKHYILMMSVGILGLTAACNDLEQAPINQYTDANFWSSGKASYLVNQAYAQMYDAGKLFEDEAISDNVVKTRAGGNDVAAYLDGTATPAAGFFSSNWSNAYSCIKTCHLFLAHTNDLTGGDAEKACMTAEVRFVRAYTYFRLVNLFGDVPFFTEDMTVDEANNASRTDKSQIISWIHSELEDIIPDLPSKQEAIGGRITKAAAAMLNARVYLYDSQWSNVEQICRQIMSGQYGSYSLFPSYAGLFSNANKYNNEMILERGYDENSLTWNEDAQDREPVSVGGRTPDDIPVQSLVDSYLMLNGYSIHEAGSGFDPKDPYSNRDPRLTATVIYDGYDWAKNGYPLESTTKFYSKVEIIAFEGGYIQQYRPDTFTGEYDKTSPSEGYAARTGYCNRKFYSPKEEGNWNCGQNLPMMRYADVLLMYAEAMNEQGKMSADVWNQTIRPIRERAGFTAAKALDYPASGDMRETIRNERRVELALEGLRFYDIKRWNIGPDVLNGDKVIGADYTGNDHTGYTFRYQFNAARNYLYPVPQNILDIDPNISQNPGWSSQ